MKRLVLSLGVIAMAVALLAGGASRLVEAQDSAGTPTSETANEQSFKEALAAQLGVTVEELDAALIAARDETGGLPGRRWHAGRAGDRGGLIGRDRIVGQIYGVTGEEFAALLGISEAQVAEGRRSGMTFLDLAEANGVSQETLRDFLIDQVTQRIDELFAAAGDGAEESQESSSFTL